MLCGVCGVYEVGSHKTRNGRKGIKNEERGMSFCHSQHSGNNYSSSFEFCESQHLQPKQNTK